MKTGKIIAILVLASILLSSSMLVMGDTEPNDDFSTAETIGEGEHTGVVYDYYDDNFENQVDIDYYKVSVPAGKALLVSAYANASNSITISFYDTDHQNIGMLFASDGALDREFYDGQSSTDYEVYLKVSTSDDMVSYTMDIEFRPSDIMSSAKEISEGQSISETIYDMSEVHWYKISIPAHKALKLICTSNGDDAYVSIYKEDGTIVNLDHGTSFNVEAANSGETAVTAYIKVSAISSSKVTYTLNPTFEDSSAAGGGSSSVSDNSPAIDLPIIMVGVLAAVAMVGIRRRKN